MADFTDQNIQDTYQRVVQIDEGQLQDGTGSALPINIQGNEVLLSGTGTDITLKIYGDTITESKKREIKQYKITAKDIKVVVKEVLGVEMIAENISF